jgi:hypothetical protein
VWQNTQQLPLERLSFHFDGLVEPDRLLSTPSFLARVTTTYQLRGFDPAPIEVDDGFTFVRQGGTWKLAGITDADDQFSQKSLPVPWDGGPTAATSPSSTAAGPLSRAASWRCATPGAVPAASSSAWRTRGRRWWWPPPARWGSRSSPALRPRR